MLFTYTIVIRIYYALIFLASFFNKKAALWINGRKNNAVKPYKGCIWFHFASLGEFEQGRPVLEALKEKYPAKAVVVTFFSPSGYEIRKNTPLADAVYYLPLDTADNARDFINTLQPGIAIFTKYEYWYYFFNELHQRQIPLYIISGIFRPGQVFFKWYGNLHRKMLAMVSHFFVQDDTSADLLSSINISNVSVSGDTRFDRVWANALQPKQLPVIEAFKAGQKVFIAGSTWPKDEELLAKLINHYPHWKFIFAPHEIGKEKINHLMGLLPEETTVRFSDIDPTSQISNFKVLVIDNIGTLSSLYQYGEVAYIGGGFGAGIHNTLEAAAFGLPVIFGPNYHKFREARELIHLKAGISINDAESLKQATDLLMNDTEYREFTRQKIKEYVRGHIGATEMIVQHI
ncbi:3-deoxy-D-manno-octulosonic acid transferase [Mucilaginibacter boryungensis]|uniref:3-deoxy-D-manno-octulosonic acid transferase n=1 Tax=Mucilaginibacter boryungensis TaxID=768480 RepID=A0ABR9XCS4_9SPHI|nr:glycosyltransferase N-terminal domain-containing protein [Mucilaginibacter boryungensis]MBE9665036.1 3-deoxy-D-manno-octulosonic acid transferase [Mucilaginibacter boryungensis]